MIKDKISVVSPVYKAENLVFSLVDQLIKELEKLTNDFEIILVEDGSPDSSWEMIKKISEKEKRVKGIKLSRNFGQHYAISAGIDNVSGEWIVVMDCDLQDRPDQIAKLLTKAKEGSMIVLASRRDRKDNFKKKFFSYIFYKMLGYLSGVQQDHTVANFGVYHHSVISAIANLSERIRYFPTMVKWVGFSSTTVEVEHAERTEGKSSYNLKRLFNLAYDIILAYSDKPLRMIISLGFIISLFSFAVGVYFLSKYFMGEILVLGFSSLIISISFFSGIIIFTLGILGVYLGKAFEGIKQRPIYIVEQKTNTEV